MCHNSLQVNLFAWCKCFTCYTLYMQWNEAKPLNIYIHVAMIDNWNLLLQFTFMWTFPTPNFKSFITIWTFATNRALFTPSSMIALTYINCVFVAAKIHNHWSCIVITTRGCDVIAVVSSTTISEWNGRGWMWKKLVQNCIKGK